MAMNDALKQRLMKLATLEKLEELREPAVQEERFEDAAMIRDEIISRVVLDISPAGPQDGKQWAAWICGNGGHVNLRKDARCYKCYPGNDKANYFATIEEAKSWVRESCSGKNFYRGICQKHSVRS